MVNLFSAKQMTLRIQ